MTESEKRTGRLEHGISAILVIHWCKGFSEGFSCFKIGMYTFPVEEDSFIFRLFVRNPVENISKI